METACKKRWKRIGSAAVTAGLFAVLAVYVFVLVKIILLKYDLHSGIRDLSLVPFQFVRDLLHPTTSLGVGLKNVLGNFAIFLPLGILAPVLWGRMDRFYKPVLLGFLVSLLFEALQFVFGLGMSDVDDLLLNTLGAAAGSGVYFGVLRRLNKPRRVRAAALALLCVFGLCGVLALWLYAPGELPSVVEYENVEALSGLDREGYTVSAALTGVDGTRIACREYVYEDTEPGEAPKEVETSYPLAEGARIYLQELSYQFSPNGNIQKTFCRYSVVDISAVQALTAEGTRRFADLWLDENGACAAMVVTVYPE